MSAEFIAEEGVLKGLILSLEHGEEWTIGRDPDLCTIVIEDPKVSRLHARVRRTETGFSIENLSETIPVLINGKPAIVPSPLNDGDIVTIGGSTFRFHPEGAPVDYAFESELPHEEFEEEAPEPAEEVAEKPKESLEEEVFGSQEPALHAPEEPEEKFEEKLREEEPLHETFEESEVPEFRIDLTQTTRFLLKVIAGPNTGAEFALDLDRSYLIGTDTATCDIIFNDLSVSREHARLHVAHDGVVTAEDLGSRNGVIVDRERISRPKVVSANSVVALGTSAFLLIDREAPAETIATPVYETAAEEEEEALPPEEEEEAHEPLPVAAAVTPPPRRRRVSPGALVLSLIVGGLAVLLGIGLVSLFQQSEVTVPRKDFLADIQSITKNYPAVKFTFNPANGKLFLLGHVRNGVEHNELLYQLKGLGYLKGIDDNVVNDEAVWQEMNILLSKQADFKGVSMHSPEPGSFVVSGYLPTEKQASELMDYLNVNFNFIDLLQNRVVVEQSVVEEVNSRLAQKGFRAVTPQLANGDLQLTGYVGSNNIFAFEKMVDDLKKIPGIRAVRNFVVAVTPEASVVDLNKKAIGRFHVTGYSKHGDVNVNVVINGRILTRGDCLDSYTITSIQPNAVFLEKDGLKYKIEYNTCNSYRGE